MFEPALNQRSSILSHILLAKSQNMKKVFNIALLSLAYLCGFGQQNNLTLQFWGSDGKRVGNEKKAKFVTTVQKINDTCWEHQIYQMKGPMIWSAQFKDKEGKVRHGRSSFMQTSGLLDSTGYFANSIPHGEWRYFDNNGNLITKKNYVAGQVVSLWEIDQPATTDTLLSEPDTRASFSGGPVEWQRYLIRNLRYPDYAKQNKITGSVQVYFLVDETGQVRDNFVFRSADLTLDNEARRLIVESPKWIPATKKGRNVTSYHQQGVHFQLEGSWK